MKTMYKRNGALCALVLALTLLVSCAAGEKALTENQALSLREKRGVLDEADFATGSIALTAVEGYAFQMTDSGQITAPHNAYAITSPLATEGDAQANETLQAIYALCKDLSPKEPESFGGRMLMGVSQNIRLFYPTLYFTCESAGYIYVLDFYAPADLENPKNDWEGQVEYGLGEEVVVEVSKLPLAHTSGESAIAYAAEHSRDLNLWTIFVDDTDYRGSPWISTLPRESFEQLLTLLADMQQQPGVTTTPIAGEGNWQALPDFTELYDTYLRKA